MRILVCGGRDFSDADFLSGILDAAKREYGNVEIINGGASGADKLAEAWAFARNVTCAAYPADWKKYGRAAGPIRNQRMLDKGRPELVIAFPGGRGTDDMVRRAMEAGVFVYKPRNPVRTPNP